MYLFFSQFHEPLFVILFPDIEILKHFHMICYL
jgi:hypothetical protein